MRWHFIERDEWEKSKGTKEGAAHTGITWAGKDQEREPVVEALKPIHEGLGLGSGSSEHRMCLRQG